MKHPLYLAARQLIESFPIGKTFNVEDLRELLAKKSRGTARLISDSHPNIWGRIMSQLHKDGLMHRICFDNAKRQSSHGRIIFVWVRA